MMEYKGYVAEVEYDDLSGFFNGRVVNTSGSYSIVTLAAKEERRLPFEFQTSIDEYLSWCEEDGVEPKPPLPVAGGVAAAADAREPQPAAASGDGN